jgi:hypothetical protein
MSVTKILIKDKFLSVLDAQKICGRFGIFTKKKPKGEEDISAEVPNFLDVHHVCLKTLYETPFLRCDCFVYER